MRTDNQVQERRSRPSNSHRDIANHTDNVAYLLQLAARLQTTDFMSGLAQTRIHPSEAFVIHELWKASPLSQSQLSTRLDVGNAAIGKTLTRLENAGFIVRSKDMADSRRVMARLTDKGMAVHSEFYIASDFLIAEIVDTLGPAGERELYHLLKKLVERYRTRPMSSRNRVADTPADAA